MIKQSKTTIKELTAQYRAVLKHAFFAGIAAVAVMSTANAEPTPLSAPLSLATEIIPDSAPAYSDGSYTPVVWNAETYTLTPGDSTTTTVTNPGDAPANTSIAFSQALTTGHTTLGAYKSDYTISNPTATPASLTIDATATEYNYIKTLANGDTTTGTLTAGDISDSPVLDVTGYNYAVTTAYRVGEASSVNIGAADSRDVPAYTDYQFKDGATTYNLGDFITADGDLALSKTLNDGTTKLMDKPDLIAEAAAALNAYGTDTTAYNTVLGNYNTSNNAYKTAVGKVNTDQGVVNAAIESYRQKVGEWKEKSDSFTAYSTAQTAKNTYEKSLAYAIDNRAEAVVSDAIVKTTDVVAAGEDLAKIAELISDDKAASTAVLAGILTDKEAKLSEQLGYNVANNPKNTDTEKAPNSLVNRVKVLTGAEGEDTSIVGAINANTDAIAEEVQTRYEVDIWLSNSITAEAQARDAADQAEAQARVAGDNAVLAEAERVTGIYVSAEAEQRDAADKALDAALKSEHENRIAMDELVLSESYRAVSEEATARANADLALQAEINDAVYAAKAGDALTLKTANDYTDAQVDTLEKNISGGVAAATALSAVEVSNVKKGEMSVGGGYGYYNGESAGAFGMAMGLSDNWSVNAGAGVASGDKTQVSFRAGTNYKFKLF